MKQLGVRDMTKEEALLIYKTMYLSYSFAKSELPG